MDKYLFGGYQGNGRGTRNSERYYEYEPYYAGGKCYRGAYRICYGSY